MIQIKRNDYVQPTQVRENVVQAICESFLEDRVWHPYGNMYGTRYETFVRLYKGKGWCFEDKGYFESFPNEPHLNFNTNEMKQAFKELIKAGYYMMKGYDSHGKEKYLCSKKPYRREYCQVNEFTGNID